MLNEQLEEKIVKMLELMKQLNASLDELHRYIHGDSAMKDLNRRRTAEVLNRVGMQYQSEVRELLILTAMRQARGKDDT